MKQQKNLTRFFAAMASVCLMLLSAFHLSAQDATVDVTGSEQANHECRGSFNPVVGHVPCNKIGFDLCTFGLFSDHHWLNGVQRPLVVSTIDDWPKDMLINDGVGILFKIPANGTSLAGASIDAVRCHGTDAVKHTGLSFKCSANDENLYEVVRIDYLGNCHIGTKSPNLIPHKLEVDGTIRAEEIIVEMVAADYVFEQGYDLKSLDEIEKYISQNGHLPNFPAAKEISAKGIALGDAQARLLEKIEELTLHLIDQNKRMQTMEKELMRLRKAQN